MPLAKNQKRFTEERDSKRFPSHSVKQYEKINNAIADKKQFCEGKISNFKTVLTFTEYVFPG